MTRFTELLQNRKLLDEKKEREDKVRPGITLLCAS